MDGSVAAFGRAGSVRPGAVLAWLVLPLLPALVLADAAFGPGPAGWRDVAQSFLRSDTMAQALAWELRLPRALAALLVGGALGMAGCLMQAVMRNPLASPDILAVTQGGHLALVLATLALPGMPALPATLLGGLGAGALALAVSGGLAAPPARLALGGLAVALACGAAAQAAVVLADDRSAGLVLWAAGALDQAGWARLGGQAPFVAAGMIGGLLSARGLDVLALGQDAARSLGQGGRAVPGLALGSGVLLAAASVVVAGPIGFVGLVAPNLLRLAGVTRHALRLPLSAAWGGALLLGADLLARAASLWAGTVPVGVVAACLGAPALMLAARHARDAQAGAWLPAWPKRPAPAALWGAAVLAGAAAVLAGLWAGDGATPGTTAFDLRAPRVAVAGLAGAALALAGALLQSASRNPLAGPETLGLAQGAALASVLAVLAGMAPGSAAFVGVALAGALGSLAVLWLAGGGASAARLTLVGLGLASGFAALGVLVVLGARLQATQALSWLAGTTYGRGWPDVVPLLLALAIAAPLLGLAGRRMDVLALGPDAAATLGEDVARLRTWLLAGGAGLAGAAVSVVGAVGFLGLLAPHAARLLAGPRHAGMLPLSAALGALLAVVADLLGRSVIAPREVPLGLVTALLGAPLFLLLLRRR